MQQKNKGLTRLIEFLNSTKGFKDMRIKSLLKELNKEEVCCVTGEVFPLHELLSLYIEDQSLEEYSELLNEENKGLAIESFISIYNTYTKDETEKAFKAFPALYSIFFIYSKFGTINLDLLSILVCYLTEEDIETKIMYCMIFIKKYLHYSINGLIENKFDVHLEDAGDTPNQQIIVEGAGLRYKFRNIDSIIKVVNLIREDIIGEI